MTCRTSAGCEKNHHTSENWPVTCQHQTGWVNDQQPVLRWQVWSRGKKCINLSDVGRFIGTSVHIWQVARSALVIYKMYDVGVPGWFSSPTPLQLTGRGTSTIGLHACESVKETFYPSDWSDCPKACLALDETGNNVSGRGPSFGEK